MIDIVPINFKSIEEIKNNFDFYKNKFVEDSVIVFRNANLTHEEHIELNKFFGEKFGWINFKSDSGEVDKYIEDHARMKDVLTTKSDEILVFWHIEHAYYKNPIVAATWNMLVFNTSNDNGQTYFVDSSKLYKNLKNEWKTFLENSLVGVSNFDGDLKFDDYKPVGTHWITNDPVIRLRIDRLGGITNKLVSVNDKSPTEEERKVFKDICSWFNNEVITNQEIRMVHKWQKGDLVLTDLFRLAHAVSGGFDPVDRKFVGIWGYIE
jgi:alpha-ketoglutarate-dependent taurine dioxygenase